MKKNLTNKGFTLVEMLVVMIIIGILVALLLPNTLKAIQQADRRQTASELRSIDTAIHMCYSETRVWASCDTLAELKAGGTYLDANFPTSSPANPPVAYAIQLNVATGGYETVKTTHFPNWPKLS